MNGDPYPRIRIKLLWPVLVNIDLQNIGFQQDGVSTHFENDIIDLFRQKFPGRKISRNEDVN